MNVKKLIGFWPKNYITSEPEISELEPNEYDHEELFPSKRDSIEFFDASEMIDREPTPYRKESLEYLDAIEGISISDKDSMMSLFSFNHVSEDSGDIGLSINYSNGDIYDSGIDTGENILLIIGNDEPATMSSSDSHACSVSDSLTGSVIGVSVSTDSFVRTRTHSEQDILSDDSIIHPREIGGISNLEDIHSQSAVQRRRGSSILSGQGSDDSFVDTESSQDTLPQYQSSQSTTLQEIEDEEQDFGTKQNSERSVGSFLWLGRNVEDEIHVEGILETPNSKRLSMESTGSFIDINHDFLSRDVKLMSQNANEVDRTPGDDLTFSPPPSIPPLPLPLLDTIDTFIKEDSSVCKLKPRPTARAKPDHPVTFPLYKPTDNPSLRSPTSDTSGDMSPGTERRFRGRILRTVPQSQTRQMLLHGLLNKAKSSKSVDQLPEVTSKKLYVQFQELEISGISISETILTEEELHDMFYSDEEIGEFKSEYENEFHIALELSMSWYEYFISNDALLVEN